MLLVRFCFNGKLATALNAVMHVQVWHKQFFGFRTFICVEGECVRVDPFSRQQRKAPALPHPAIV